MSERRRLFTFASGGWVVVLSAVVTLGILAWALAPVVLRGGPLRGDGVNVESYRFDLSTCLVGAEHIVASGMRKDALRALVDPPVVSAEAAAGGGRGKYLVAGDRVIGVTLGGESRAYPLAVLNCHEVANDILGGVPIAITYNPLCDSALVFDRRFGGETLEFGVSGLLHDSNLVMYDRRPGAHGESLWSQLQGRAIAGPAAARGAALVQLPAVLTSWSAWLEEHSATSVLAPDPAMTRRYEQARGPYEKYFADGRPRPEFPFDPAPPAGGPAPMERVVAVEAGGERALFSYDRIARAAAADPSGSWTAPVGGVAMRFRYRADPPTVVITHAATGEPALATYSFWFAWHAAHPDEPPPQDDAGR